MMLETENQPREAVSTGPVDGSAATAASGLYLENHPARLLLTTMLAVFVIEAGIMALLAVLPPLQAGPEALVDSTLLSVLLFPILYLTIFRPLLRQIEVRKQTEGELQASRSILAEAQRVAHVGHWVWGLDDGRVEWSEETYCIFGVIPGATSLSFETYLECVHPEDREGVRFKVEESVRSSRGWTVEHRFVRPDGAEGVVAVQAELACDDDGRVSRVIGVVQDITERRRVQYALEEAYEELDRRVHDRTAELAAANVALQRERNFVDAVVDTAGALVIVLGRDGNIVRFNKACEEASGYTGKEVRQQHFWDLLIPEDERAEVVATFSGLRGGDFPNQFQNHWVTKQGDLRFISWSNTAICDGDGQVEYVIGTGVDSTDRRSAERALIESEERFRTILRTAQDGFWTVDSEGRLADVNDAYCRLSGYTRDELIGSHISLVEVEEDRAEVDRHLQRIKDSGHDRFESRHRCKEGRVMDVEVTTTHLPFGRGQVFAFLRDVTDKKRDAAELERRRAELEAIINSNADAIVFTDTERHIAFTNPAFTRMFGYSADEARGRSTHFLDVHKRPSFDGANGADAGASSSGRPFEIECRRKDGTTLWVETQAVVVRDRRGAPLGHVGVHRDVSQRRAAEAQIRASLQEKEVLLKEIHHRVKNNLQVIASMLNLQADQVRDETALAPLRESQNRIRSLALIHEKLYRSDDLAHIDFRDYVKDLAASVVSSVNRTPTPIAVETDIDDVAFGIDTAIPVALIVNELVSNSVKHAFCDRSQGLIRITLRAGDESYTLVVEDDGIGLPADLEQRTVASLGLQLVDVLAAQLDGTLSLGGDEGARFEIEFKKTADGGRTT